MALSVLVCAGMAGAGCSRNDALRAELEHHDARVTPTYSSARVALDATPLQGQGAPYAAAPAAQE